MSSSKTSCLWYVLHTRSRFENVVYQDLIKKSFEAFLPKIRVRSKRKDRKLMISVPLFPGYTFVKTDLNPHKHLEIVKTVGAVRLIGNKDCPVPVPNEAIESLKIMISADEPVTTGNRFRKGDKILVVSGPFAGIVGYFLRHGTKGRVIVNIEALGQSASVEVSEDDIEKLPEIFA
jgi:transcriptional antiterminator NusG